MASTRAIGVPSDVARLSPGCAGIPTSFDERDRGFAQHRKLKPRRCGEPGKPLPMTEQLSLVGGDGEGRDVVQRRGQRQNRPRQCARLSGFLQKVQ